MNEQEGLAIAAASSDAVTVEQNGAMSAGGNGDTATSSAVAAANLTQTANQSNVDSKTIARAEETPPAEGEQTRSPHGAWRSARRCSPGQREFAERGVDCRGELRLG